MENNTNNQEKAKVIFSNEDGREISIDAEVQSDGQIRMSPNYGTAQGGEEGLHIYLFNLFASATMGNPANEEDDQPSDIEETVSEEVLVEA
jgi:hypothetical protein